MKQNTKAQNRENSHSVLENFESDITEKVREEIIKKLPMVRTLEALMSLHEMLVICLDNEQKRR